MPAADLKSPVPLWNWQANRSTVPYKFVKGSLEGTSVRTLVERRRRSSTRGKLRERVAGGMDMSKKAQPFAGFSSFGLWQASGVATECSRSSFGASSDPGPAARTHALFATSVGAARTLWDLAQHSGSLKCRFRGQLDSGRPSEATADLGEYSRAYGRQGPKSRFGQRLVTCAMVRGSTRDGHGLQPQPQIPSDWKPLK